MANRLNLTLKKPIIFFDLETTGLDFHSDEIIEIYALKIHPDQNEEKFYSRFYPELPFLSDEFTKITNITFKDLEGCPLFKDKADNIYHFFNNCDLCGFNIEKFDVPFLTEKLFSFGYKYNPLRNKVLDIYKIYNFYEPRTLENTYKYYTGQKLENTHRAEYDTQACLEIFKKQQEKYQLSNSIIEIKNEMESENFKNLDFNGKFLYDKQNQIFIYNFGKYKGQEIDITNKDYLEWIQKTSDFDIITKLSAWAIENKLEKCKGEKKYDN